MIPYRLDLQSLIDKVNDKGAHRFYKTIAIWDIIFSPTPSDWPFGKAWLDLFR